MKSFAKKTVCFTAAAALSAIMTCGAYAEGNEVDFTPPQVNKTYLNINVQNDIGESFVYSLVDKEGNPVISWADGAELEAAASVGVNITGMEDFSVLEADSWTPPEEMSDGYLGIGFREERVDKNVDGSYPMKLDSRYYFTYYPKIDGCDYVMPANSYGLYVDEGFKNKAYKSGVFIFDCDANGDNGQWFNDYATGTVQSWVTTAGEHELWSKASTFDGKGNLGTGGYINVSDHNANYVKVTMNLADVCSDFNRDGTITCKDGDSERIIDLKGAGDGTYFVGFYIRSGAMINAVIPDSNGNVTFYVSAEAGSYGVATSVFLDRSAGGRNGSYCGRLNPAQKIEFNTEFSVPEDGLTLYDIPEGDYEVVLDSDEYILENNTITITGTKDLQSIAPTVKEKPEEDSSSETESSSAAESEADSSSESSSDTDSKTDSSSVSDSSSSDSGSDISSSSSVNSQPQSNGSSGGSSGGSSKASDSNPNTGTAAGCAAIAVVAMGVAAVKSKNK